MFRIRLDPELELELLEARHAEELFALVDANRAHLDPWFDWVEGTRGPEDSRAFIERGLRRFARGDGFDPAGIRERGRLVGCLGLHFVRRPEGKTEIGYWLSEDAQGRGVVTRAVAGLLPRLYRDLDLNRVEIRCEPDNRRSRAVPERLGFTEEGVLREAARHHGRHRDHVVHSLLRREWDARAGAGAPARAEERG